ncbi:MAG: alpha-amylase [Anaerolineaceae bacterium]|nr:alpha-amylase [Anaerolineaceae bacterium]
MDFIFGTLASDGLKLVHHRAMQQGVQHAYRKTPRDPGPGQPVTITVTTGQNITAAHVACYYTLDGSIPAGSRGAAVHGYALPLEQVETTWDTLSWSYVTTWEGTLPPQPSGTTVRYSIGAWDADGAEIWADWPDVQTTAEHASGYFFRDEPLPDDLVYGDPAKATVFAYHVDTLHVPEWAREAVIYQVFVDRFYPGDGRQWLQTTDLMGFCGGTLEGVEQKLGYIADLGATCIWLSPTWLSPTHHGYDILNYKCTEPRLGGNTALRSLIDAAHRRGIRVLLDLVCNHMSYQNPIFLEARKDPTSPYRDWFTFNDSRIGYRTFFTSASMPQINLANPAARDWMLDIARYWLREFDVDGYRLDYALGPGPAFWGDFRAACREVKADSFCFGEVVDAPDMLRQYEGQLDGALDFHSSEALRKTFGWKTWPEAGYERFAARHTTYFPPDFLLPTFLDNHDMDRFLFIAGGDKAALRRAAAEQMRLPGPPIIYYGTEVGLSQKVGTKGMGLHTNRVPMAWGDDQDTALLAYYTELIESRKQMVL